MANNSGVVKFYKADKKFGFIQDSETNQDIFVHESGLIDQIKSGDNVSFSVEQGKKGPNAVNVMLVQ